MFGASDDVGGDGSNDSGASPSRRRRPLPRTSISTVRPAAAQSEAPEETRHTAPLDHVSASSRRYADATTGLSEMLVELEAFLNSLPGKREVFVRADPSNPHSECLAFRRGKDGRWNILHEPSFTIQVLSIAASQEAIRPLRDRSVDEKLRLAPLLPRLLEEFIVTMDHEAAVAEQATASVAQLIAGLNARKKGGQR